MKKKSETKNANFIDLDKEEFKKKKGFLKYFFFLSLFIVIFISIFYYTKENLSLFEKNYIERDSSEKDENVTLKIDTLANRIDKNELQISNAAENLNLTQKSIEEVRSKTQDNFEKIRAISKDNALENTPDFANIDTSFNEQNKYLIKYMLFRTLIDKFLNRKDYSIELDLLISLLKQNRIDLDWDEKFEFLQKSNFKSMDYLLTSINRLVYEQRITESLQEKSDLRKSRSFNNLEDFKTYFFEEINSLITIKKVQDNSLRDISEKVKVNKSNVKLAKEYLLIGNIQKSVEILSLEENNINDDIKRWLDSAKLFLSTIDKIEKLEKEIFINE
ncbi:hypothetical protein OBA28_01535 [Alphaproteobacteria bacterium]|nr:hypothetical protein [Alphaproteobacteria bacterium]